MGVVAQHCCCCCCLCVSVYVCVSVCLYNKRVALSQPQIHLCLLANQPCQPTYLTYYAQPASAWYLGVTFSFARHMGPVYGVAASPFHRNLILSCSTDMRIHVTSLLARTPLAVLEPDAGYLYDVQWSPARPLVFAAATGSGAVVVYDLLVRCARGMCLSLCVRLCVRLCV